MLKDLPGCFKTPPAGYKHKDYLCHVNSDDKGVFRIKTVPPGNYNIRPHYVKFDVQPVETNVLVMQSHVHLDNKFLVGTNRKKLKCYFC